MLQIEHLCTLPVWKWECLRYDEGERKDSPHNLQEIGVGGSGFSGSVLWDGVVCSEDVILFDFVRDLRKKNMKKIKVEMDSVEVVFM